MVTEPLGLPGALAQDLAAAALGMARRLERNATLWCVGVGLPQHASHLAVEFLHPVVIGARAFPAVALPSGEALPTLRGSARAGDVLVLIGVADSALAVDLARRAPAWGLAVTWVGFGPRPPAGAADHVLWLADEPHAPYDGRLVLLYHLLWELTQVCLEHPGLLVPPVACDGPICITCSDEGRLAEVLEVTGTTARVRTADGVEDVDVALIELSSPGDLLLVHAGSALTKVGP